MGTIRVEDVRRERPREVGHSHARVVTHKGRFHEVEFVDDIQCVEHGMGNVKLLIRDGFVFRLSVARRLGATAVSPLGVP